MGKRGPKPGFKKAAAAAKAAATVVPLSSADRENPEKLSGDALRAHAHRRGMARSELTRLSDEKIREQLRYLTYRQYEAA